MRTPSSDELEMYQRWGVAPPSHDTHGSFEEIQENLVKAEATSWRLEGNKLIAETNHGPVIQFIPTDYILTGTDKKGLPIFKRVI